MYSARIAAVPAALLMFSACAQMIPLDDVNERTPTSQLYDVSPESAEPIFMDSRFLESTQTVVEFSGSFDPATGFRFERSAAPVEAAADYRTAASALSFCTMDIHGGEAAFQLATLPGTTSEVLGDCVPAGEREFWGPSVYDEGGALCANVQLTSHLGTRARSVYVEITSITAGYEAYRHYDVGPDEPPCCGSGADLTFVEQGINAPTDLNGGLFEYGTLLPGDSSDARWVFRNGAGPFEFRGRVVARIDEVRNGLDDDCDGRVDDSVQAYPPGAMCERDEDCASLWCLDYNCL